jgi:hypothetical protein
VGYSGLIYAAIVACWAAFLVPRWIRRNEEVERAREEDAARGVRVLERSQRAPMAHSGFYFAAPVGSHRDRGRATTPTQVKRPVAGLIAEGPATGEAAGYAVNGDRAGDPSAGERAEADGATGVLSDATAHPQVDRKAHLEVVSGAGEPSGEFRVAARRRRRVLTVLVLAVAVVATGTVAGRLPDWAVLVPVLLLAGFLVLARQAAVAEARRRARQRQFARRRAQQAAERRAEQAERRVAVLDEPEPVEPPDPNAWEPVPVPLPTYLTKAKAEAPVVRKIDLSSPGAWTSGRLNPASSITLPPPRPAQPATGSELPEHRRAVGD